MIDSTKFDEFRKWHKENPNILHWTIKGGVVEIISLHAEFDTRNEAQRLARALRYRKMDASSNYRTVSLRSRCEIEIFLQALRAVGMDWNEFKDTVSHLYFDGNKHIADKKAAVASSI